jgi:hypothetical protein
MKDLSEIIKTIVPTETESIDENFIVNWHPKFDIGRSSWVRQTA